MSFDLLTTDCVPISYGGPIRFGRSVPTRRQADTFCFIAEHMREHGEAPTYSEIAKKRGVSMERIRQDVWTLYRKGWIAFAPQHNRAVRIRTEPVRVNMPPSLTFRLASPDELALPMPVGVTAEELYRATNSD